MEGRWHFVEAMWLTSHELLDTFEAQCHSVPPYWYDLQIIEAVEWLERTVSYVIGIVWPPVVEAISAGV